MINKKEREKLEVESDKIFDKQNGKLKAIFSQINQRQFEKNFILNIT